MKKITFILFISLFFGIIAICMKDNEEFSLPEECFTNEITKEEITDSDSVDDYKCCYLRQLESMRGNVY